MIVAAVGQHYHVPLPTVLFTLVVDMAALSLLSFGILTPVVVLVAEGSITLLLAADAAAYALSGWLVRRVAGEIPEPASFPAAFAVEVALVFAAIRFWIAAQLGPRLMLLLMRAIQ